MTGLAIGYRNAKRICDTMWPDKATAERQAGMLDDAGWMVVWRAPGARFGADGPIIRASIHHPQSRSSPGDVMYQDPAGATDATNLVREPGDWRGPPPDGRLVMQRFGEPEMCPEPGWITIRGWRHLPEEPGPVWTVVQVRQQYEPAQ